MWSPRSRQSKDLKTGKEAFHARGENVDFGIFDFWRWAHSDMLGNAARGVLAEYRSPARSTIRVSHVMSGMLSMLKPRVDSRLR